MPNPPNEDGATWCCIFPGTPTALDSSYPYPSLGIDNSGSIWFLLDNTVNNAVWALYHHKANAKAWATFNGSSGAISDGYNVSSVTRNSTGNYTITFSAPLANANYATSAQAFDIGNFTSIVSQATTNVRIRASNIGALGATNAVDPSLVSVIVFGQQNFP